MRGKGMGSDVRGFDEVKGIASLLSQDRSVGLGFRTLIAFVV